MAGGGGGRSAASTSGKRGKFSSPIPMKKARIEIVPLIDVMFFLLAAFMMVSLSLQQSKTRPMELIDAKKATDDFKPDVINIGVEKDGTNRILRRRCLSPATNPLPTEPSVGCFSRCVRPVLLGCRS